MDAPPAARVTYVGLTGGLGAGKSAALAAFAELGAQTISADAVVHELLGRADVAAEIGGHFGRDVLGEQDGVDRAALARRAFSDPHEREWLEGLLWPRVRARMAAWRGELERAADPVRFAVAEVPLLFESDLQDGFDYTVAVVADERVRRERAAGRGHELPDERAGLQLSQAEKAQRAGFVVRNDGSLEQLKAELSRVLETMEAEDHD